MLTKYSDRIEKVSGDYELTDGVWILPHKTKGLGDMVEQMKVGYEIVI